MIVVVKMFCVIQRCNCPVYKVIVLLFRVRKSNISYKTISHLPNEAEVRELKLFVGKYLLDHINERLENSIYLINLNILFEDKLSI